MIPVSFENVSVLDVELCGGVSRRAVGQNTARWSSDVGAREWPTGRIRPFNGQIAF